MSLFFYVLIFLGATVIYLLAMGLPLKQWRNFYAVTSNYLFFYVSMSIVFTVTLTTRYSGRDLTLYSILYLVLYLIAVIDHHHLIIPDTLQVILLIIAFLDVYSHKSIFGALAMFALTMISSFRVKNGLGGGDIKFLIISGFYLGYHNSCVLIMAAAALALLSLLFHKNDYNKLIPFGPFLVVAFFIIKEFF